MGVRGQRNVPWLVSALLAWINDRDRCWAVIRNHVRTCEETQTPIIVRCKEGGVEGKAGTEGKAVAEGKVRERTR